MASRLSRALTVSLAAVLVFAACGDDDGSGPDPDPVLSSVSIDPTSPQLDAIGATVQLDATATDGDGAVVTGAQLTWSSDDTDVATVDAGLVTAVGNGTATIQVQASDASGQASATTTVTVEQVAADVVLSAPEDMLTSGESMQLTATATDANGNAIDEADFTFTSSEESVATVSATGLVTAAGPGETTLTASLDGEEDTAVLTVVLGDVTFDEDATISGTLRAMNLTIATGVTVTASDDVAIEAAGAVDIQGTLSGDCVALTLDGGGSLDVSGTVDNTCSGGETGPAIELVNAGPLSVSGGTFMTSGSVSLANDGTGPAMAGRAPRAAQVEDRTCTFESMIIAFLPAKLPDGNPGGAGDDIGIKCVQTATFVGGNQIEAQSGGDGLDDEVLNPTALGANGGPGGGVRLEVLEGDMIFQDNTLGGAQGTALAAGDGGAGGDAVAVGTDAEPDATATGGSGAVGGDVSVQALNGDIVIEGMGGLRVHVGDGGAGGEAEAQGHDGEDPGEDGGAATAVGGAGANSGAWSLTSIEAGPGPARAITGRENIIQDGGNGGAGGTSTALGGNGADGDPSMPDGGNGGDMSSAGGAGGNAIEFAPSLLGIGDGGDGGDAWWENGRGGNGADLCWDAPGGAGGSGGNGVGAGFGLGGTGGAGGEDGSDLVAAGTGDGGMGGAGVGPGPGGEGGDNGTGDPGDDAWRDGDPGMNCMATFGVELAIDSDPDGHEPFVLIAATVTELKITLFEGEILVEGDGNWIDVAGAIDASGDFVATGTGNTANGSTGVEVELAGTVTFDDAGMPTGITGTYTVGTNGVLPGGQPVSYAVGGGG